MELKIEVNNLFDWIKQGHLWSGGANAAHYFKPEEIDMIQETLEEIQNEPWEDIAINDLFWFDTETLCDWCGITMDEWEDREKQW